MSSKFTSSVLTAAAALCLVPCLAAGVEAGSKRRPGRPGVMPAGIEEAVLKTVGFSGPMLIQHRNPFKLLMPRADLKKFYQDASDIHQLLLQVYDPEKGRWTGYGLMDMDLERVKDSDQTRFVGASIDYVAPAEGIYCLRVLARDRAGQIEKKPRDIANSDIQWLVVMDRTAPVVTLRSPTRVGKNLTDRSRLLIEWDTDEKYPAKEVELVDPATGRKTRIGSNAVEVSHDGGQTWNLAKHFTRPGKYVWPVTGPNTDDLRVRVVVRDAAGNVGVAESRAGGGRGFRVTGFEVVRSSDPRRVASAAKRTYQRGVIYMTRGDHGKAVKQFKEAIRLDPNLLRAYVDLSASYLHLYDRLVDKTLGAGYLQEAEKLCLDALKRKGFDREVTLHHNLAQVYYRDGQQHGKAVKRLQAALNLNPRHIESLYLLALIRLHEDDLDEARKLWKQVAALGAGEHPLSALAVRCLRAVEERERLRREAKVSVRTPISERDRVQ